MSSPLGEVNGCFHSHQLLSFPPLLLRWEVEEKWQSLDHTLQGRYLVAARDSQEQMDYGLDKMDYGLDQMD
jgi:hypothetical protein